MKNNLNRPTKDELISFIDQGMTGSVIAKIYNVKYGSVYRWMKEYNLRAKYNIDKYLHLRDSELTDLQKEFIFGNLLGDGFVCGSKLRLMLTHYWKQLEYLEYCKSIIDEYVVGIRESDRVKKNGEISKHYHFTTIKLNKLQEFRNMFYVNDIKIVPDIECFRKYLSPFSLAIWFMDDGSKDSGGYTLSIASEGFLEEGNNKLKIILKELYDLDCKVNRYFRKKYYYKLVFSASESRKLSLIIRDHVIDSMKYKLIDEDLIEKREEICGRYKPSIEELTEDYKSGLSIREISKKYKLRSEIIGKQLKELNIFRKKYRKDLDPEIILKIKNNNDMTIKQLCDEYNLSETMIWKILHE